MTAMPLDQPPAAMLERVASLLEVFAAQRPLTLTELSRQSKLPRSSAHRILQGLVEIGWVERHGFRYALGVRMFEIGNMVRQRRVPRAALPIMTMVHQRTGLTAHLSILSGAEIVHVERVGLWPGTHGAWNVGSRQAVEQTAAGQALLASLPENQWPMLTFDAVSTEYGVRTREQLDRAIAKVWDRGRIGVDEQGSELGVTVVAAPIDVGDQSGRFAFSLCGPTRLIPVDATVLLVRLATLEIQQAAVGLPTGRHHLMRATQLTTAAEAVRRVLAQRAVQ